MNCDMVTMIFTPLRPGPGLDQRRATSKGFRATTDHRDKRQWT